MGLKGRFQASWYLESGGPVGFIYMEIVVKR